MRWVIPSRERRYCAIMLLSCAVIGSVLLGLAALFGLHAPHSDLVARSVCHVVASVAAVFTLGFWGAGASYAWQWWSSVREMRLKAVQPVPPSLLRAREIMHWVPEELRQSSPCATLRAVHARLLEEGLITRLVVLDTPEGLEVLIEDEGHILRSNGQDHLEFDGPRAVCPDGELILVSEEGRTLAGPWVEDAQAVAAHLRAHALNDSTDSLSHAGERLARRL